MLEQIRAAIRAKLEERSAADTAIQAILDTVEAEGRNDLNTDEAAAFAEKRDALTAIDAELADLRTRESDLAELAEARTAAETLAKTLAPAPKQGELRVGSEPLTYRKGGEHSFLQDSYLARFHGDTAAAQRLVRHGQEMTVELRGQGVESRDVGTSAYGALVVPQYLTELYAAKRRAGRPLLDSIRQLPLPAEGMTVEIPRITTGTGAAAQATQNSGVQETDLDETTLSVNVRTYAGQQDVSRQALERGRMTEEITVADLISAYHTTVDSAAINADGTGGTHLGILSTVGINSVTWTEASPTAALLMPKLADACNRILSDNFGGQLVAYMHPRRWMWLLSQRDGSQRPLVVPAEHAPQNALGTAGDAGNYGGVVGTIMPGIPVVLDANIPTTAGAGTEDRIIVLAADETFLWEEGGPLYLRFEETTGGSLTTKLVVYGYSAFSAGRYPTSVSVISGTGLIAPVFA
jgi:HK97 family phage major capsid protein